MGVFIIPPLPPLSSKESRTAGPLRSTGVTPLPRYSGPVRHPLAFGRLPHPAAYLASGDFSPGRGGLHQTDSTRPCRRAAAPTPPERSIEARGGWTVLPSPVLDGLDLQGSSLSGLPPRSLTLRPGDSLTTPRVASSMGFRSFGFPPDCHPSYGASGFCSGGTDSH